MAGIDETKDRRKVRTKDGGTGAVMQTLTTQYVTVQTMRGGLYKVYHVDDLEDITEDEFRRNFR